MGLSADNWAACAAVLNLLMFVGSCALLEVEWDDSLWGVIASDGQPLGGLAAFIGYPLAYRLRERRWICLMLVALPALLVLPMALELGWMLC